MRTCAMICASLMAESVEQMISDMCQAKAEGADIVEVRLDSVRNFQPHKDLELIIEKKSLPIIVVYRPKWDGGLYEGDEQARLETLNLAKELGAEYVDYELKVASNFKEQKRNHHSGSKIIVSCYVNGVTPSLEDLRLLVEKMQATGADVLKIVTDVTDITETARIFHLLSGCQMPLIAYSLGERGFISNILSKKYGGFIVYGSLEGNSIPGLSSLYSLRQTYGIDGINKNTKVFGLISKPVGHSKGPILHNPAFRLVKFNGIYVPMFVDDLKRFFSVYTNPDFAGFSVGFPYKEAIIGFCDEVHPLAKWIGAVNTIIRRPNDGKLVGYNTDSEAAIAAIEDAIKEQRCTNGKTSLCSPIHGKLFVLAGAGGAGRALAFGAKSRGARVVIFDIDYENTPRHDERIHQYISDTILRHNMRRTLKI